MTDTLSPQQRSKRMALVKNANTRPELKVRSLLQRLKCRYRQHVASLPGCPDILFASKRKIIFVHGCFWHRHMCRMGNRMPKSNLKFWQAKLNANRRRDIRNRRQIRHLGFRALVLWECQILKWEDKRLLLKIRHFLADP